MKFWNNDFVLTVILMATAYSLAWVTQTGQLAWKWAKPPIPALLAAIPTGLLFAYAVKYSFAFSNQAWFFKIMSHFMGTLIFALFTWMFIGEAITWKIGLSIFLCFLAVLIQL